MRAMTLKSKFFALCLAFLLISVSFVNSVKAEDWTDYVDKGLALLTPASLFFDIIRYNISDSTVGELLDKAANSDYDAMFALGMMYYEGKGVELDHTEASEWWRKSAENGHIQSQLYLGIAYYYGDGVEMNKKEAMRYFILAAKQRDEDAMKLLHKAAEQGDVEAQAGLGAMYAEGIGVFQDKAEGVKWLQKAAEQGHEDAKAMLKRLSVN